VSEVLDAALAGLAAGLNVYPPKEDGTKRPDTDEWTSRQQRLATELEVHRWYANGRTGLGFICGAVSGGLELFEFEGRAVEAGMADDFIALAEAAGLTEVVDRVAAGYTERSPSGGLHWLYRCSETTCTKLARQRDYLPLIETKGEGGYVITAPSHGAVHETGQPWVCVSGAFDTIAMITPDEREALHRIARTFDQVAKAEPKAPAEPRASSSVGPLPGEDFNSRGSWENDVLGPKGWTKLFTTANGNQHWRRPGKNIGTSATISEKGEGVLYVFTSSTPLEPNIGHSKWGAFGVLHHQGDFEAAAKALYAAGYGVRHESTRTAEDTEVGPFVGNLAELLADVETFIGRFVAFPSTAALVAETLWVAHAHAIDAFESTPRLAHLSPEKGSGKTRALEVMERLVPKPMHAVNCTAAALFRAVSAKQPTLLFDECDTYFGARGRGADTHEELRGLINAGHRRGAVAYRCVGEPAKMEVREFPAFCAVSLAGIGDLPDTILDRSIVIRMKRRAPHERIEPFRMRQVAPQGDHLRKQLKAWAKANRDALAEAEPVMPAGITDRPADVWEPLLAIADAAGGDWPTRARAAALELTAARQHDPSLGVRLLADVRDAFGVSDRLFTETVLEYLTELDEAPWGDLRGRKLDARGLASRLRRFGIAPRQVRIGETTKKGYVREDFVDAWGRYLPASLPSAAETSETAKQEEPATAVSDVSLSGGREGRMTAETAIP
jgi:hypothetical protein